MSKPTATPMWLELNIDRVGNEIRISARGCRGEGVPPRSLGIDCQTLRHFTAVVQRQAASGRGLDETVVQEAHRIRQALLDDGIGDTVVRLSEAANGPILVRIMAHDPVLQAVPWEALCESAHEPRYWGVSADLHVTRGIVIEKPWKPREVLNAIRLVAIAPMGEASLNNLKIALADRIASGEVEWQEPIVGEKARAQHLKDQLHRMKPHVVHFIGHGRIEKGKPELRFTDKDEKESWVPVHTIAEELKQNFHEIRLIVLEMCEGATPTAEFAPAAAAFVEAGADAVVAHLWPVRADVALTCSTQFYKALAINDGSGGDVAKAMNDARRDSFTRHESSVEAISGVLYMRGNDSRIFDFRRRIIVPPRDSFLQGPVSRAQVPAGLLRIMRGQFSLILGDRWKDHQPQLHHFRRKLHENLGANCVPPPAGLPIGTLAQWFALRRGNASLEKEFQRAFRDNDDAPPIVAAIAPLLCPGIHTTLLRKPWLEMSLAEHQPNRTIYLVQPGDDANLVMKRSAGTVEWQELKEPPTELNLNEEILILRPYGGYTVEQFFTRPLMTEDDYCQGLHEFWTKRRFAKDFADVVLSTLHRRPALMLGLSLHTANHRMLLRGLHERGIPRGSLAMVEQNAAENDQADHDVWQSGRGLVRGADGIEVIALSSAAICFALGTLAREVAQ